MLKVWRLHNSGVEVSLIAMTLGISSASVSRIVNIMTMTQNGEDVDAFESGRCQAMKDFAKEHFGIVAKKEEVEKQEEQKALECVTAVDDITKEFMQKVLLALAWQNELLERLLDSLGVEWKNSCGKVERR